MTSKSLHAVMVASLAVALAGVSWYFCHYVDWYSWGVAKPPDRADPVSEHPAAELLDLNVDGIVPSESEVVAIGGRPIKFECRLRLKNHYWNRMPSIPDLIRMRPQKVEQLRSQQAKLPECIFILEIVCKSSLPPGEKIVRRLATSIQRVGRNEAEWSSSWAGEMRQGTYLVRCLIAEREMKTKAGEALKPLRNVHLSRTFRLRVDPPERK